jgi:hypothetical protein
MRYARHTLHMGGGKMPARFWQDNLTESDHLEGLNINIRILKCIFMKSNVRAVTELISLRIGTSDYSDETSCSIKCREFID